MSNGISDYRSKIVLLLLSQWLTNKIIFDIILVGERKASNFFCQLLNNQAFIADHATAAVTEQGVLGFARSLIIANYGK